MFLFNDGILYTMPDRKKLVMCSNLIPFDLVIVNDLQNDCAFELIDLNTKVFHTMVMPSASSKAAWLDDLVEVGFCIGALPYAPFRSSLPASGRLICLSRGVVVAALARLTVADCGELYAQAGDFPSDARGFRTQSSTRS